MTDAASQQKMSASDFRERMEALDTQRSFLVRAPAGSGKTHLLTTRFLRLLSEVDDPREVVAITFTRAAAAEMRQRIVLELKTASETTPSHEQEPQQGSISLEDNLLRQAARLALQHIRQMQWTVIDYPDQLRIQTIDSFCNAIAMRAPLQWGTLSTLGGRLEVTTDAKPHYRTAARRTLAMLQDGPPVLREAIGALLRLRDARWVDAEKLLLKMLADRGRWFKDFVFDSEMDEGQLRARLESPMLHSAIDAVKNLEAIFDRDSEAMREILELCRFAAKNQPDSFACSSSLDRWPKLDSTAPSRDEVEEVLRFYREVTFLLLTQTYTWRKGVNIGQGFPAGSEGKTAKERFILLVERLRGNPNIAEALEQSVDVVVTRYTEDEWEIVRKAFVVLRYAAAQLQLVFSEKGTLDFTEVAALALRILRRSDGSPSDFALDFAAGIRHLLMDEFQDTSRKQYELIDSIVAAWPGGDRRTCFCVGDPMQSIYGFRESDFELFERPVERGFGADHAIFADSNRLLLEPIQLRANFRSNPYLVADMNRRMPQIFATSAGTSEFQTVFYPAEAAREAPESSSANCCAHLHLELLEDAPPRDQKTSATTPAQPHLQEQPAWIGLIREHLELAQVAQREFAGGKGKYRIAILGRKRQTLIAAARALEAAGIPYLADDLIPFSDRMEVLDALSLAQAALNPQDRLAWSAVLRAPWCGLTLTELHRILSADDPEIKRRPVVERIEACPSLLGEDASAMQRISALRRTVDTILAAGGRRHTANTEQAGSWLHRLWRSVGGHLVTTERQQRNLQLAWKALDQLPRGDLDLLESNPESGWRAALNGLRPLPDPEQNPDFGLHLMTIHKAKGLEFEIVLLPEMERLNGKSQSELLAWMERGSRRVDEDELTEFLIAPIQAKGRGRGKALAWVMHQRRMRESAEERRVFYVAATRAREQLHLFGSVKASVLDKLSTDDRDGSRTLLEIVAPAFREEISQFASQQSRRESAPVDESRIPSPDAGSSDQQPVTAADRPAARIMRLRTDAALAASTLAERLSLAASASPTPLFERPQGGLRARAEGVAVHLLMQQFARLRARTGVENAREKIAAGAPALAAHLGTLGVSPTQARQLAEWAVRITLRCADDPIGAWILKPHPISFAEVAWSGQLRASEGRSRWGTARPDRCFLAESYPEDASVQQAWWIIDYKTTGRQSTALSQSPFTYSSSTPLRFGDSASADSAGEHLREDNAREDPILRQERTARFLAEHHEKFAPQLQVYAGMLLEILAQEGNWSGAIRVGIYYPIQRVLDHWLYHEEV